MRCKCAQCGKEVDKDRSAVNRAAKIGAKLFCGKVCFGLSRRVAKEPDQKKAEKKAYDAEYRVKNKALLKDKKAKRYQETRDPEKERVYRQAHMHRHVEYCRRPEYREKKHEYDKKRNEMEYADFAESWRLLQLLESEIRSQASAYEVRKQQGYYTRNAQKRRRELWQLK